MKKIPTIFILLFMAVAFAACKGANPGDSAQESEHGPTATVRAVPLKEAVLSEPVTAYGTVVPAPGTLKAVSLAYDAKILAVAVSEGEAAQAGARLIEVEGAPDALLALSDARLNAQAAERAYEQVKVQNQLRLADDAALASSYRDYQSALARQKSMEERGPLAPRWITSPSAGVVVRLPAQAGAIVPSGSPLAEIADPERLAVRLGVEPAAARRIGMKGHIEIRAVEDAAGKSAEGAVSSIAPAVNPATRLVDLYASLPGGSAFILGEYVEGKINPAGIKGLVVPYEAVLPQGGGHVIFTVENGKAVRREVRVLSETDKEAQVEGAGLAPGQMVVTVGAYELEEGMPVRVENGP